MPCRDSTRRRPTQARTTIAAALPSPITSRPLCHRSMPPLPAWLPFGVVQSDTDTFIDSFIYVKPALCSHPPPRRRAETTRTPFSTLKLLPGLGLDTCFHTVPFQRRIRVWSSPPLRKLPTAHASHGDKTVTPASDVSEVPGLGGRTPVHAWHAAAE